MNYHCPRPPKQRAFDTSLLMWRRRFLGGSFSPASLFASGEDGGWYDPSDLTSLRQKPVLANIGQPEVLEDNAVTAGGLVGIVLDKSQMGGQTAASFIAGQPELSPFTGAAGFSAVGATTSFSGGVLTVVSGDGNADRIEISLSGFTVGRYYRAVIRARQTVGTAGRIASWTIGGVAATAFTSNFEDYEVVFPALLTSGLIRIYAAQSGGSPGDTIEIESVSVKEIPGNHLVAPALIQRPILRDEIVDGTSVDVSGQPELVTNGTFDTDTSWAKNNFATISGGVANLTATNDAITQTLAGLSGSWFILSFDFDRSSGTNIRISAGGSILEEFAPIDDNPSSATRLFKAGASSNDFSLRSNTFVGTIDNVSIKLVPASAARRYYLDFDGVDDEFSTSGYTAQANPTSLFTAYSTTDTQYIVFASGATSTYYVLAVQQSSSDTLIQSNAGTPSYRFNGTAFTGTTRGDVYTACLGAPTVVGAESVNLTGVLWTDIGMFNFVSGGVWQFSGRWYGSVFIDRALTTAERENLEIYLANKSGATLAT